MATRLMVATDRVSPDEKAYWLMETWRRDPLLGDRRTLRIAVLRGQEVAVYEEDLGPWDVERDTAFQAPGLWEYSVAELQEIAVMAREGKPPRDPEDRMDIITVWAKELDEQRMRQEHRSTFGAYLKKER